MKVALVLCVLAFVAVGWAQDSGQGSGTPPNGPPPSGCPPGNRPPPPDGSRGPPPGDGSVPPLPPGCDSSTTPATTS